MNPFRRADRPLSCAQVGRRLQRYLDGEIDDLMARRILRHLEDCRRCGMQIETYRAIRASLARQTDAVPEDTVDRLRSFGESLLRDRESGDPEETGS